MDGQEYIQRKERDLVLLENALRIDTPLDSDEHSESYNDLPYRKTKARMHKTYEPADSNPYTPHSLRYESGDGFQPWIDKISSHKSDEGNTTYDELYPPRKRYPMQESEKSPPSRRLNDMSKTNRLYTKEYVNTYEQRARDIDLHRSNGMDDEKPRSYSALHHSSLKYNKPNVEERLERKWKEYFGDRLQPSYNQAKVPSTSWGHASALEELRHSTDVSYGEGRNISTEKRLQSHTDWLKSVKRDTTNLRNDNPLSSSTYHHSGLWKPPLSQINNNLKESSVLGMPSRFEVNDDMDIKFYR